jgi:hypothetical protein
MTVDAEIGFRSLYFMAYNFDFVRQTLFDCIEPFSVYLYSLYEQSTCPRDKCEMIPLSVP